MDTINPPVLQEKPKQGYFTRLFAGRLNRQNYILGSTFFALVPLICFLIVIFNILLSQSQSSFDMPYLDPNNPGTIITPQFSLMSLLATPANEFWAGAGMVFLVLSLPYLFSLQIRRLHDLNLTGWLWIINFVPLISLYAFLPGINMLNPPAWLTIVNGVSFLASLFPLYVSLWPGTNGSNKYGDKPLPRSSFLGDILEI